jgi:3-hydroxybutyryl-CoA dehydrogenase
VIRGPATHQEVVTRVITLLRDVGKQPAEVADCAGFVSNRLQMALLREALAIVAEGQTTREDLDTIVRSTFGFRLPFFGPFAIADMAGLDVYNFCYKSLQTDFPERFATPKILSDLVEAGKLGTKTGAGFLNVPAERTPELIAYRNKAYVAMQKLIDDLGPAPIS